MGLRSLTEQEIASLTHNGCRASEWGRVRVGEGFDPQRLQNVRFTGDIAICDLRGSMPVDGTDRACGIRNCTLHDCRIEGPAILADVGLLSGYDVGPRTVIERTGRVMVEATTTFGQGTQIRVINEGGGREVPIFDRLSAPLAYVLALYRHDTRLVERICTMIDAYVKAQTSARGRIGAGVLIRDTIAIRNARVGEGAVIDGASTLDECTIASNAAAPCRVGEGAVVRRCVILSGATVDGGARLESCFVGQAVTVGRQFFAEHSAFFANSEALLGEACSVMAGPYSVTHHRSTLLIAAYLSFFNAGSGTNQSNHLYKLGPLHQGILERGCKTGSSSYLLWPARVGAFTSIMGKHTASFDTTDLPFSSIAVEDGKSFVYPSTGLVSSGVRRDGEKWMRRDRREDPDRLDPIVFDVFNPYTVGRIVRGIRQLREIEATTAPDVGAVMVNGIHLHRVMARMAEKQYELAVRIFIGSSLARRLAGLEQGAKRQTIMSRLECGDAGTGDWVDYAGLIAPSGEVRRLLDAVTSGAVASADALNEGFHRLHANYDELSWSWCARLIADRCDRLPSQMSSHELSALVTAWVEATAKINRLIELDAGKEFDQVRKIGFGIDGGAEVRDADFLAVRGTMDGHAFIRGLREETAEIRKTGELLIGMLGKAA